MANQSLPDERYFDHYHSGKLPNQVRLLEELVQKGFDSKAGKRILTTDYLGVPVTIFLLLLNDSRGNIAEDQAEIKLHMEHLPNQSTSKMMSEYSLYWVSQNDANNTTVSDMQWDVQRTLNQETDLMVSGSPCPEEILRIDPKKPIYPPLSQFLGSKTANTVVCEDHIKIKIPNAKRHSLIHVFKHLVSFLEYSYAISERVKKEVETFNRCFSAKTKTSNRGNVLQTNCSARGHIIHQGAVDIKLNIFDLELRRGSRTILDDVAQGFEQVCNWVNETYGEMHKTL